MQYTSKITPKAYGESFYSDLFQIAIDMLIAKKIIGKGTHAAQMLGISYETYKNLRINRTQFSQELWYRFLDLVRRLDPQWTYAWLCKQLIPDLFKEES